ncbi:MAG: type VI secretion system baseplate subunit TssF [Gemmataceae bacterium]
MTDSERLFGYYDKELTFIRQLALDFKARYPRVANRLSLDAGGASADPHVERIIEAFALLTANVQVKLDDEFPELTDALLSVLYPHYLAPLPSMAIVQLALNPGAADAPNGFLIPKHSPMTAPPIEGVACRYRTGYSTKLWPIEVADAKFREPPYPPGLEPPAEIRNDVRSYMRLTLRCTGGLPFEQLSLDMLRLFILGDDQMTVAMYETLFTELVHVVILPENRRLPPTRVNPKECVRQVGFDPDESLLPYPNQSFAGYRLLTEFFAYPARFNFFDLCGWSEARTNGLAGRTAEVIFYFSRPPRDGLIQGVGKGTFATGCVPIINLFEKQSESFKVLNRKQEYALEADVHDPHGYEIYSVDDVTAINVDNGETRSYQPFYSFHHRNAGSGPPFWYASRRPRFRQKLDGRADLEASVGSDIYLRLIDPALNPANVTDETVNVRTTCLNRDLPKLLREAGEGLQFEMMTAAPVRIRCLRLPTVTLRPPLRKQVFWRLLSHMNLNYLSLSDPVQGREAIQEYLRLYDFADPKTDAQLAAVAAQAVEGLISVRSERTVQFTGSQTGGGYARGVAIDIELDEEKYTGVGAYLFASVLERFLALYVSVNSFTQLTARTRRKDTEAWKWPPRAGEQAML